MNFPYKIINLTQPINENSPTWSNGCGYEPKIILDYKDCDPSTPFKVMGINMELGFGTHLDAPAHCNPQGRYINQLNINDLFLKLYVIDISHRYGAHNHLKLEDVIMFEQKYEPITSNSAVIINTGWHRNWLDKESYHNNYQFPYVDYEAAQYLYNKNIKVLGVDTLSPERPSENFAIHQLFLNNDKLILENIAFNDYLQPIGGFLLMGTLPIMTTECPLSLWAFIPR
jgi:kynurenine formamidase